MGLLVHGEDGGQLYGRNRCVLRSDRDDRCRDGMVRQAKKSVGASESSQCYGSGEYSDRSSRYRDVMEFRSQQDGALWLSEVSSQHGQGDKMGHSDGSAWAAVMVQCENSVGVGGIAREPAGGPTRR